MTRVRLCRADEVELGSVRRFEPEGAPVAVAVANCDGGLHAVVDNCSHEDYRLSEGEVFADVCEIECVRHGSTFSLVDGTPQSLPATRPITVLALEVVDGDVFVELP
ncbi:MAG: Rieske 2Fe-2S domain-containing protein [Acidimicrobiales bacterium]